MSKEKIILFIFIIWSIWISLEFLLGPFSHVRIHDNGDSILPQLMAERINFEKYGISYFVPYIASGVDGLSQTIKPFSNLNNTLFILLPGYLAYGLLMLLQRFLASYFTYKLARDSLKLQIFPSIIAGLIFSLFNFSMFSFTLYHQLGIPALPLILYILEKILSQKNLSRYFYLIAFSLFVGWANDFVYFTPYIIPIIFVWFIFIKKKLNIKLIADLLIFSCLCIVPQLPNIIAVALNAPLSHRAKWGLINLYPASDIKTTINQILHLLWANVVAVTIIILSFRFAWGKKTHFKTLLIISAFIITVTYFSKNLQRLIPTGLGIFRTFTFDRFEMNIYFFLSLTAACALNFGLKKANRARMFIMFLLTIILIASSLKIKIETFKNYAPFRSLYMQPDLRNLARSVDNENNRVVTIAGGGIRPHYMIAYGLSAVDGYLTLYPKPYHDFWARIIENIGQTKYLDFTTSGNKIYLYGPEDFDNISKIKPDSYYNLNLLSVSNVRYFISTKPLIDKNLLLIDSDYRDKFIKWQNYSKTKKIEIFLKGEYFGPPLYIYENKNALQRFFMLDRDTISKELVNIEKYSPDKITLSTNSSKKMILVIAENFYPWWKATINNQQVLIERYEETFMSFEVPAGNNQIILEYSPPYKSYIL